MLSRQCKNRISKASNFVLGVPHVWVITSLETKMKKNGNKNMLHFSHEQNYDHFKEKSIKKNIKTISRKKEAIFNYTLFIAIFNAP